MDMALTSRNGIRLIIIPFATDQNTTSSSQEVIAKRLESHNNVFRGFWVLNCAISSKTKPELTFLLRKTRTIDVLQVTEKRIPCSDSEIWSAVEKSVEHKTISLFAINSEHNSREIRYLNSMVGFNVNFNLGKSID